MKWEIIIKITNINEIWFTGKPVKDSGDNNMKDLKRKNKVMPEGFQSKKSKLDNNSNKVKKIFEQYFFIGKIMWAKYKNCVY